MEETINPPLTGLHSGRSGSSPNTHYRSDEHWRDDCNPNRIRCLVEMKGIEPLLEDCQPSVLPLNYIPVVESWRIELQFLRCERSVLPLYDDPICFELTRCCEDFV